MAKILSDADLDTIFRQARSHNKWQDRTVSDVQIEVIYDLLRWGPTSANSSPARFIFCKSQAAKDKLASCVLESNVEKVKTAPVVAIIGYDEKFYDKIPQLFPHNPDARSWFSEDEAVAHETAFRNSSLQGAYLMIAARAIGLDCGPMSGFDADKVNAAFFMDSDIKVNFICAIGYGDESGIFPRSPRLSFAEASEIL
ncbi:MAG: malonic semialdehyde reductase [Sphingomonadales bacterium]|jgi:nitroreductase